MRPANCHGDMNVIPKKPPRNCAISFRVSFLSIVKLLCRLNPADEEVFPGAEHQHLIRNGLTRAREFSAQAVFHLVDPDVRVERFHQFPPHPLMAVHPKGG